MVRIVSVGFLFLVVSVVAHSAEEMWSFSVGEEDQFSRSSEKEPLVNRHCHQLVQKSKKCLAQESVKHASMKSISSEWRQNTSNPGVLICLQLKGSLRIGKDSQGNENSFCEFSDHSRIDCGSLVRAALQR